MLWEERKRKGGYEGKDCEECVKVGRQRMENQREDEDVGGRYGKE